MHAITDPGHTIEMPPLPNAALMDVLRRCLDRSARTRITMQACSQSIPFGVLYQAPMLRAEERACLPLDAEDNNGISKYLPGTFGLVALYAHGVGSGYGPSIWTHLRFKR